MEFINIWEQEDRYQPVIDFWNHLGALPPEIKSKDRAKQLVFMARQDKQIWGVTTAIRTKIIQLNDNYFYYFRILIHPDHRIPGLSSKLTVLTRDFLEKLYIEKKTDCIGMIVITEKKEYMVTRNEAVWRASKLTFIGALKDGRHMRVYYFKGARI